MDPYYFTYQAEKLGYHSQIILNGRIVNDGMGKYIADATIKQLILAGKSPRNSKVVILGLTFKENCPDTRNSKVSDIIARLREFEIAPVVVDKWANPVEAKKEYNVELTDIENVKDADCIILAVAHNEFKELSINQIDNMFDSKLSNNEKIIIDVKGILNTKDLDESKYRYWRL